MSKLTDAALSIRHAGTRTWALPSNPETAVLAHHPKSTGIDQKSLDICGAWTCHTCHSAVDGRIDTGFSRDELRLMHRRSFQDDK